MASVSPFVRAVIISTVICGVPNLYAGDLSIGMNLNRVVDYNPSWVFVDAMKSSRPWISIAYDTATKKEQWNADQPLQLDAAGMPSALRSWKNQDGELFKQYAATLVFREIGDAFPGGVYRAEWKGKGKIEFSLSGKVVEQGITSEGVNFARVMVRPSNAGIMVKIVDNNIDDPIRDLHLWMPNYEGHDFAAAGITASPFHPLFKRRLAPFTTLRFVDWTATNWTTPHSWAERTKPTALSQSGYKNGHGVALELIVALSNETGKDVWINTPPWADDEYVRKMAELFRDQLDPERQIYVEWANELWNFAPNFATHPWLKSQTALPQHHGQSLWQVAAFNIRRDMEIWTDVFAANPDRIVRVVAGQSANPWVAKELIKNVGVKNIDAVACSAYIQLTKEQRAGFDAETDAEDVLTAANVNLGRIREEIAAHKRLVDMCSKIAKRPIKLVAYEGGQHFDAGGRDVPYLQALYDAQTHPGIEPLYRKLMDIADAEGVELLNHYAYVDRDSLHGTWGALSRQDQPLSKAPKYRALLEKIKQ